MIITGQQYMNLMRNTNRVQSRESFQEYFGCLYVIDLPEHKRELVFKSPEHETMFMLKYSQAMNDNVLDRLYQELIATAEALQNANKT